MLFRVVTLAAVMVLNGWRIALAADPVCPNVNAPRAEVNHAFHLLKDTNDPLAPDKYLLAMMKTANAYAACGQKYAGVDSMKYGYTELQGGNTLFTMAKFQHDSDQPYRSNLEEAWEQASGAVRHLPPSPIRDDAKTLLHEIKHYQANVK